MKRSPFGARPGQKEARPTTSKALAALMSILGPLSGFRFLDAFSGTGRVALAALQKGASVVTIELLPQRARAIKDLLAGREHQGLCCDVRRGLHKLEGGAPFDVIFADPPYGMGWCKDWPALLAAHPCLLAPGGLAVLEHADGEEPVLSPGWRVADQRRYGGTKFTFFLKEDGTHE